MTAQDGLNSNQQRLAGGGTRNTQRANSNLNSSPPRRNDPRSAENSARVINDLTNP